MRDSLGRDINYLRVSVTDRCNLACRYCRPGQGGDYLPYGEVLRLEEIARLAAIMAGLGVRAVRFTGGEPLLRKNLAWLVGQVSRLPGVGSVGLTTNGLLLAERLPGLLGAGLSAVNISLDTVDAAAYREITGTDGCGAVLAAIGQAVEAGLATKVNCVPYREEGPAGQNAVGVAALAQRLPVDVRFIELMPLGCGRRLHGLSSAEVLAALEAAYGPARPVPGGPVGSGPAVYYAFGGFRGRVGFISPMSRKFCATCNRVRLTAAGFLKLCLYYKTGLDLRPLLRGGAPDGDIAGAIAAAVAQKPAAHDFGHPARGDAESLVMSQIGG